MSVTLLVALIITAALLAITAYSVMGSLPLLILKHDTPTDSSFIRSFFNMYYFAAILTAAAAGVSYVFASRPVFAVGAAALALILGWMRFKVIAKMDSLRKRLLSNDSAAIAAFRRLHLTVITVNLAQLILVAWCLVSISLQMK